MKMKTSPTLTASRHFADINFSGIDGADTSLLVQSHNQTRGEGRIPWALTVRTCVHDDDFGITMDVVAWVLRRATTRGWAGFVRSSASESVHHIFCHADAFELVEAQPGETLTRVSLR